MDHKQNTLKIKAGRIEAEAKGSGAMAVLLAWSAMRWGCMLAMAWIGISHGWLNKDMMGKIVALLH